MKKWVIVVGVGIFVAVGGTWLFWGQRAADVVDKKESSPPAARATADELRYPDGAPQLAMIKAESFSASTIPVTDSLSGRLAYDEDVTARVSVSFSGRIVALKASPGDIVRAGQPLAEIDSPDFGAAYADLNKARADEERKKMAFQRAEELLPDEAIALKDWEAARADRDQARAETARAELRLKNLNPHNFSVNGQRIVLASPVSGVVTERTATPALEVNPSLPVPLFVVTNPKRLWLMIDLPEKLLGRIKVGGKVEVESDAYPAERFAARVVQLGQIVDTNTRRVTVRALVDNQNQKLLPEMFVRAQVLQDSGLGVRVPNSAIVNQGIYAYVYVQTGPGVFVRRKVALLSQGGDASVVGEGLKGGEQIVTTGVLLLDAELTARTSEKL